MLSTPIGNNIGRHNPCPLMLPPVTHKRRKCRGLSARWLALAFAWWRLPVFVSVDDLWRMVAHVMPLASFDDRPKLEPSRERSNLRYSRCPLVGSLPLALSLSLDAHFTRCFAPVNKFFISMCHKQLPVLCPCKDRAKFTQANIVPTSVSPEGPT